MYNFNGFQSGVQYVNGYEGAMRFNVMPNTQVLLMDSTRDVFYLKTLDSNGLMPTIRCFEFKEIHENNPNSYVTKGELEAMFNKYLGGNSNEQIVKTEPRNVATD